MRKRFIPIVLVLVLMTLTACGGNPQAYPNEETAESSNVTLSPEFTETECRAQDIDFYRDNLKISGELLLPATDAPMPLVILSHGFGGNRSNVREYAQVFAQHGIAACIFDFIGGGRNIKSDGSTTEMSVLTEASDLETVLDVLKNDGRFDADSIFLFGESQGGFVSTYVAGNHPDDIAGLVVLYPAYVLQDNCRDMTPDINSIPDTMNLMGTTIGSIYNRDALSFDIYDQMAKYDGKVLIIHGTSDSIAPISYSERAIEVFPDAELIRYDGANHGFYGNNAKKAAGESLEFAQELLRSNTRKSEAIAEGRDDSSDTEGLTMKMKIGDTVVGVAWEQNESVDALQQLVSDAPLTIQMSMYSDFEQLGSLGQTLPRNDKQTTTGAGDIVLYSGNQIVVFYGSNSWAYTRLGKITDKSKDQLKALLGNGDVVLTISLSAQE